MLKVRTKLLLFAMVVSGIGIGVLSGFADGAYSAICLFIMPLLVALAAASIIADFNSTTVTKPSIVTRRKVSTRTRDQATAIHQEWASR
jgi:hypothetical protein